MSAKPKRRPERFPLRLIKGGFAPADRMSATRLRERGYRVGDIVFAEFRKPRNPRFWGLAHVFGQMLADNIESFEGLDAHKVLKRLQIEAGVGCEITEIYVPGLGKVEHRTPRSLSFESMDEGEFREVMRGFSRHVAATYWPELTPGEIEQMAEVMVSEG